MHIRHILALATVLGAAAITPLVGQQAPDSTRVAPAISPRASAPSTIPLGPRLSSPFQRTEPRLAPSSAAHRSFSAFEGGQHTIVISTLAIVLAAIIVVLLVVR